MITSWLAQYGMWLLIPLGILVVYTFLRALHAGLQSRRAAYYSLRREALTALRRWSFFSGLLLLAMIVVAVSGGSAPPTPIAAHTATPAPTVSALPTRPAITPVAVASPTAIDTPTFTPAPTAAATTTVPPPPTPLPTVTPTAPAPAVLLTPLPGAVPPRADAVLTFTTFASVLDAEGNPRDAGVLFPAGTRRIRVFFRATGVNNGATWSVFCYKGDELIDQYVGLWQWGARAQTGRAFCAIDGSLGRYRVTAFLGTQQQFEESFDVIDVPAAAPVATPAPESPPPDSTPAPEGTPAG